MKTDNYLNLCLEQAELSPLGHRHGCIVVKGGKVIGKGFNDYRPGFDGGALKTGVLPSKSFALDKQELKSKTKKDFKHFEAIFSGARPGRPVLSMHSEMMAINSALSSSSTLAATSLSRFKPSPAPSRDSKRKRQLRRDILTAYSQSADFTAAVPQALQQHTVGAPASGWRFEPDTCGCARTTTRVSTPKPSLSSPSSKQEGEGKASRASAATEEASA
ncbi:hypothetical protein DL768_000118 [Monosporascus sp. mg162]|nr:hypothetical protein DL768_000118 [Monosporascus sp. mg162]